MLGVLLTILKIIGLILLAFLCLVLLLILIILFVPIKYKAVGEYKEKKPDILLNVSYFLHIVSVSFTFKDKKPEFYIKIFGFKLKKKKKIKKDDTNLQTNVEDAQTSNNTENNNKSKDVDDNVSTNAEPVSNSSDVNETTAEDNTAKTSSNETSTNDSKDEIDNSTEENETETKVSIKEKISKTKNDIDFYINLIKSDYFKNTFYVIKHRIGKILKSILPKRGRINLWLGFENAGTTGEIVGIYKALYSYIGHVVKLNSYYDRECTDVDFNIKGRIYIFIIAFHGLCILLNRNVLKILKMLKKRKK